MTFPATEESTTNSVLGVFLREVWVFEDEVVDDVVDWQQYRQSFVGIYGIRGECGPDTRN